jgi:hypothetical protein
MKRNFIKLFFLSSCKSEKNSKKFKKLLVFQFQMFYNVPVNDSPKYEAPR